MENRQFVCSVTDLAPGSMRTFRVKGKQVALANVDGEYFAVDDSCTHNGCSLGTEGVLDGNVIICGCHGGQFDVTNGKVMAPPPEKNTRSYTVKIADGNVYLEIHV